MYTQEKEGEGKQTEAECLICPNKSLKQKYEDNTSYVIM